MAGKAKSCYLSVYDNKLRKTVFTYTFLKMADLNAYIAKEEFLAKYPTEQYTISKEVY
jgi:hypothetical protein